MTVNRESVLGARWKPQVQFNVNIPISLRDRVDRATRRLSYETDTTITKGGLVETALDAWLTAREI